MAARSGQTGSRQAAPKAAGEPLPIYAISGAENFLKAQALQRIVEQSLRPDERPTALAEYEGAEARLADVLDDVRTLPFLAPRRVVIVRDADDFISEHREHLEEYAEKPCSTGTLVLECRTLAANTRLYKRIAAVGECITCDALKGFQLPQWLMSRCQSEQSKRLDQDAARYIVDHIGDSLGQLDSELAKLAVYVGARPAITLEDAMALVGQHREQKVFGILNAMADGDRRTAIRLWEEVWQTDRAAPHRAVGGIAYGVRQMLSAHEALRDGTSADMVGRRVFMDPETLRQRLGVFTPDRLQRQLAQLGEADLASKTGAASVQTAIERFIFDHTAPPRRVGR